MPRLVDSPGALRLVAALFASMVLGFALLAHVNLRVQDGGGELPTPQQVLWKYHGKPGSSRLHTVLDPELPEENVLAMWPFLGTEMEIGPHRDLILDWVDRGAPEDGWPEVEPIFTGGEYCGQCHAVGGQKEDVPFDEYASVLPYAEPAGPHHRRPLLLHIRCARE